MLKLTNSGNIAETGLMQIALDLSPEAGGTPVELALLSRRLSIRAGHTTMITVPVKSVPTASNGTYTLTAQLSDSAGHTSTASSPQPIAIS